MLMIALCVQLAFAPLAIASEAPTGTITVNQDGTLTVEHIHTSTDDAPTIPEALTHEGQDYTLSSVATADDPGYERPSQHFTAQAFNQVPAADAGNWAAYFPATYAISEGVYQGMIGLSPTNTFAATPRYHAYLVQVDKLHVIYSLPDNDVTRLPELMDFQVACEVTPGATVTRTLRILDVSYEISGRDHLGLPNSFTAYVTYRGQEGLHELEFYDVTANYSGSLNSATDQFSTIANYSPVVERAAAPLPQETVIASPDVPLAQPGLPLFPLVIGGAMIAVFLAIPLLYFFILSNARLVRVLEPAEGVEGSEGVEGAKAGTKAAKTVAKKEKATSELICRRRLVLREGLAEFRIPPGVDVFDGALYCVTIKPYFASHEGILQLTWQGKIIATAPIDRHVDINFREMIITSTEAALMEAGLLD